MKKIKWVIILMIFILISIVVGSFIKDKEMKAHDKKYGTPIQDISFSYKLNEVCSNPDSCEETFEVDDFNGKTIMIDYKKSAEEQVDQIKIGKFIYNSREGTEIDSFGTYRGKYFVIVLKWSTSLTTANREVIYYDKNFDVVSDVKLVNDDFDIPLSSYKYYSCTVNTESTSETDAQKYTINSIRIDDDFNFNVVNESEMYKACSTADGY